MTKRWIFATVAALPAVGKSGASARVAGVKLTSIGTFDAPLYVTAPPGDRSRLFVVERAGTIRLVKKGRLLPTHGKARGANFGWNVFEGDKRNRPGSASGPVRPALVYSRAGLPCAVVGGYVVRDHKLPALRGRYVYGDSCTGRLSSVKLRRGGSSGNRVFATVISPTSFGEDASGRVYVTSLVGDVYRLTPR